MILTQCLLKSQFNVNFLHLYPFLMIRKSHNSDLSKVSVTHILSDSEYEGSGKRACRDPHVMFYSHTNM